MASDFVIYPPAGVEAGTAGIFAFFRKYDIIMGMRKKTTTLHPDKDGMGELYESRKDADY